ncbi:MAG: hypothetical protein KA762_15605 [Ferruginibacter sp.]|nr:hypothetical protein [Ferruginibacter sp.]
MLEFDAKNRVGHHYTLLLKANASKDFTENSPFYGNKTSLKLVYIKKKLTLLLYQRMSY